MRISPVRSGALSKATVLALALLTVATNNSVNAAALRGTAYYKLGRTNALLAYVELYEGQREEDVSTGGNASKVLFGGRDPFGSTKRYAYEDFLRIGVGYAF